MICKSFTTVLVVSLSLLEISSCFLAKECFKDRNSERKTISDENIDENSEKTAINENERQMANDLYEKALLEMKRKVNSNKAYDLLQKSAKLNHQMAKEMVAKSHLFGDHLSFDPKLAFNYFNSIPINQSSASHLFMGYMYSMGLGVKRNPKKSLKHYILSANLDNSLAKMVMAFKYNYGIGVATSCSKAMELYHSVATSVVEDSESFGGNLFKTNHLWDENKKSKNYFTLDEDLIKYYKFLAKSGDTNARISLGHAYYYGGHGVERDIQRSYNHFKKASESGNGNALAFLGKLSFDEKNYSRALHLFEASVLKGNPIGLTELGLMHLYGNGVNLDFKKAFQYISRASRQGWAEGLLQLALIYLNGYGVARDYRTAFRFLALASQSKHLLAYYNLGQMYASGKGVANSCPNAVIFFQKVAERGIWSKGLAKADDDFETKFTLKAFLKYSFLSELGYESAQSNTAFLLENHVFNELGINHKNRRLLAFKYWKRSALQGMSFSRIKTGDYHYYGLGTPVDYKLAIYHYQKASEVRYSAQALFNLGYMFEKGLGVDKDLGMARVYYRMSSQIDSDAKIPVLLVEYKLKFNQFFEHYFTNKWDLILIIGLCIVLCFLIYFKR